jgi:hypothetical protein
MYRAAYKTWNPYLAARFRLLSCPEVAEFPPKGHSMKDTEQPRSLETRYLSPQQNGSDVRVERIGAPNAGRRSIPCWPARS